MTARDPVVQGASSTLPSPVIDAAGPPARFIVGDTRDVVRAMPDASVDLVLTSPPFLALRSYLPAGHPDKHREIGSEPTPADFLDTLLELAAEWRRVLAPHGSIAVELGDTYAGHDNRGSSDDPGKHEAKFRSVTTGAGWPLGKSLTGIPHLFHLSLAYGRNLLTGEESPAGQWRVRNVVAWCRPNPPVGALGDKFRPATSYMTIATPSRARYFDLDAVRGNPEDVKDQRFRTTNGPKNQADPTEVLTANYTERVPSNPGGPPPLDWWEIPTQPFAGAHYATWPEKLCDRPILAMVPPKVCTTCGEPSQRILDQHYERSGGRTSGTRRDAREPDGNDRMSGPTLVAAHRTLGWTDCGHDTWRRGVVLDPFAGSGTTLKVAVHHGRDAIGIDLDERNAELARGRVGMFLTVEHHEEAVGA